MFGYVKPYIPDLRVREYEFYRSVYCGLCRSMKKHTGGLSRVTLSFDMTFFALVRLALLRTDARVRRRRCFLHPLRKRPMMDDNEALAYTAQISAVLAYYKLEDTVSDEKGLKRFVARTLKPFARRFRRRALRSLADVSRIAEDSLRALSALEKEKCAVPDMPADVFGDMLGRLLAHGLEGTEARIAYEIGLHTGRWVYLADALCDRESDRRSGSYNPFLLGEKSDTPALTADAVMGGVMALEAEAIMRAVDLIDFSDRGILRACIENIIYDGMENAVSTALGKERNDDERSLQDPWH